MLGPILGSLKGCQDVTASGSRLNLKLPHPEGPKTSLSGACDAGTSERK